jgi:hypothetical protein
LQKFVAPKGDAMKVIYTLGALLTAGSLSYGSILPPNDLHLEDTKRLANITEEQFRQIIDDVVSQYQDVVAAHGATLQVNYLWTSTTVNATADRKDNQWIISMYGGLARRNEVTPDAFALVVCHELGHHLAGFPFYSEGRWAATEGQSDYFSSQVCARKIWKDQIEENARYREIVEDIPKQHCDQAWSEVNDQNLCYRISVAGKSLATLLAAGSRSQVPSYETPDTKRVEQSVQVHPAAQCRLDTYLAAALCPVGFDETTIPSREHPDGQESLGAEYLASTVSCTESGLFGIEARPRCWFKPNLDLLAQLDSRQSESLGDGDNVIEPGEELNIIPGLRNDGQKNYPEVQIELTSQDPWLTIDNVQSWIGDINPNQIGWGSPAITMGIRNDAPCGKKLEYLLVAHAGDVTSAFPTHTYIGSETPLAPYVDDTQVRLRGLRTTDVKMEAAGGLEAERVKVSLRIDTQTGGSRFEVWLVSPQGHEYKIHDRTATKTGSIEGVYEIELRDASIGGTWKLVAKNHSLLSGYLKGWKLNFSNFTCD